MSDAIIVAGVSKGKGSQFSLKQSFVLSDQNTVMTYSNLRKKFHCFSHNELSSYNTPYLAGIYIYNYLARRNIHCSLINFLDLEIETFQKLLQQDPKIIALSTSFLTNIKSVKEVTQTIWQYAPDTTMVLGGPLVYNSYLLYRRRFEEYDTDSCKKDYFFLNDEKEYYEDVDLFVVEEQGAETLYRIISAVKNRRSYEDIPNIAYYKNHRLIFSPRRPENFSFSDDFVQWDKVPKEYLYPIFPLRGSRGCPYCCKFCNFAAQSKFQLKSLDNIVQEINGLLETGQVQMIRFTDDNLFLKKDYLNKFCRRIIALRKNFQWTSFLRANSVDETNVRLLKASGLTQAQIGMESGDPRILKAMDKKDTPENYLRVVELLNRHGISTQLYFIIGFPGETVETVFKTIELINNFNHQGPAINEIMVFPFVFAPLSPIYNPKNRLKYGIDGYMTQWTHPTMNSKKAMKYAQDLFLNVENVYPHYGIEEFLQVGVPRLKRITHLRSQIRKAQLKKDEPKIIDQYWRDLKNEVCSAS